MATFLGNLADTLNNYIWAMPLIYLCLGGGLIFTIALRGVQVRHLGDMGRLLFNGKKSQSGLSSFQAFCMAIAGRVGTGNIAGVATAIFYGGPGALFWMWMVAILGAATTFIECTMAQLFTGIMLLMTGSYNVTDGAGGLLAQNISESISAGAPWVQIALEKHFSWGGAFIAIAMCFFGFTTIMNNYYSSETHLAFFWHNREGGMPKWAFTLIRLVVIAFTFIGAVISTGAIWNWSDTTLGIMTWMNMIAVACMLPLAMKLLRDFESQQKLGLDPIFDPDKLNIPGTELWREIRDKFKSGDLKN